MKYIKVNENEFEAIYIYELAANFLVVASVNKGDFGSKNEWCAYIGATKTKNYKDTDIWMPILLRGTKLSQNIAEIIFPFSKTHRWRR